MTTGIAGGHYSAVLTLKLVYVLMFHFFVSSFSNVIDLYIEMKCLSRERMVGIKGYVITLNFFNSEYLNAAFGVLGLYLHTCFDISSFLKLGFWDINHLGFIIFTVAIFRLQCNR